MATGQLSHDFDEISRVYDETRQPPDPETIDGLVGFMREHNWTSVLEVGVGTGRIAEPLGSAGLRVAGLDASRGMLERAAAKGIPRLVQGTAYRLPFLDHTFDVVLFVHVLHMLEDPGAALAEAARVSRSGVLALMDREPSPALGDRAEGPTPRELMRQVLTDLGYPNILRAGPRVKEREILAQFPPRTTRVVSDREVTELLSRQLDTLEKRAYRHVLKVPREELARAVALARERIGSRTVTYRRNEAVVWWPTAPNG